LKGDVTEAERGHDGEGPVEAGQPGVLLSLLFHDDVEQDRVEDHERGEGKEEAEKQLEIALAVATAQIEGEQRGKEFHLVIANPGRIGWRTLEVIVRAGDASP
jgi:hypothetical protein